MNAQTDLRVDVLNLMSEEILADVRQRTARLGLSEPAAGSVLLHALARLSADAAGGPVPEPWRPAAISMASEGVAHAFAVALNVFLPRTGAVG